MSTETTPISTSVQEQITQIGARLELLQGVVVDGLEASVKQSEECKKGQEEIRNLLKGFRDEYRIGILSEETARKNQDSIADTQIKEVKSLWEQVGKTPAGKAAITGGMLAAGGALLKLFEALPAIIEASKMVGQ